MSPDNIILPDHVEEEAKIYTIEFYTTTKLRLAFFYLLCIITLGLVPLLCYWKNSIYCMLKYKKSKPSDCKYVVVYGSDGIIKHLKIQTKILSHKNWTQEYRSFTYRLYSYYYDENDDMFKACQLLLSGKTYNAIHLEYGKGLPSKQAYRERLFVYGLNLINITAKSNLEILVKEVLSPYYFFQLFAWIFWGFYADYVIYAWIIFSLSTVTLSITFFKIKSNYNKMLQNVQHPTQVIAYRPQEESGLITYMPKQVDSTYLVPGDLIEIQPRMTIPCDIILISGTCIMNESMVIGESENCMKYALPNSNKKFDFWASDHHVLYGGTECMETSKTDSEPQVIGVVIRTGFSSMKGRLIRSYLYSKRENFQFYKDSFKYIGAMFFLALLSFIYTIKVFIDTGESASEIISESLDAITIAVPPILPTLLSIGLFFSGFRLEKKNVVCRSELKINVAGRVQVAFFDKTGTLTEDSLDLHGIHCVSKTDTESPELQCIVKEDIASFLGVPNPKTANNLLLDLMATCHSLIFTRDGLKGHPLDMKMFKALGWQPDEDKECAKFRLETLDSPNELLTDEIYIPRPQLNVVKKFSFTTKLQRTCVIVKDSKQVKQRLNVKGVPKTVKRLCRPETIPEDFDKVLTEYTQNGFVVVACATRTLENVVKVSDNIAREYYEKDLEFLGFIVFENKLKDTTSSIVTKFTNSNIPSVMLTGDNSSSAYFVAKQCNIINPDQKVLLGAISAFDNPRHAPKIEWVYMDEDFKEKNHRSALTYDGSAASQDHIKIDLEESNSSFTGKRLLTHTHTHTQTQTQAHTPTHNHNHNDQYKVVKTAKDDANTTIAMTGDAFRHLSITMDGNPILYQSILKKTKLFTKLRPEDKALIVKEFQKFGYVVAMCGDGVNDCPALKIANVGLALNENEASLAASFIGKIKDISCMDVLIREGRCSLMTSFQCFKYMCLYSIVQTLSMAITYAREAQLPNPEYLYQDIGIVLPTALALLLTKPLDTISKDGPSGSLLTPSTICSVVGQGLIQAAGQAIGAWILHQQDWYVNPSDLTNAVIAETGDEEAQPPNYDSTILFLIGNMQLITMVVIFYVGRPFREPLYKNWVLTVVLIAITISNICLILVPSQHTAEFFEMKPFDAEPSFKWIVFGIVALNSTVSILYEKVFLALIPKYFGKMFRRRNYVL